MIAAAKPHQHPDGYRGKKRDYAPVLLSGSLAGSEERSLLLGCEKCIRTTSARPRRNRKMDLEYEDLARTVADPYGLRSTFPGIGL